MVAPHDNETRPDIVAAKRTAIVAAGVQIHGAKRRRRGYDNSNQVTDTPLGTNFTAIAGGDYHSLALKSDGSLINWGRDGDNQVTDTPLGTNFTAIAGAGNVSLALKSDGSLISWGYDGFNQVTNTPLGTDFTAIAGGDIHSLALSAAAVPEPATAAMVLLGAGGLICRRRAA